MPFNKPLVAICCPGPSFSWMWVNQWSMFLPNILKDHSICMEFATSNNIYGVRNRCVADITAATEGCELDYVLWIDSDNLIEYDQFLKLKAALEDNPQAAGVGAWYWAQSGISSGAEVAAGWLEGDRHLTQGEINDAKSLIEVDYMGFGFLLMRGSVLRAMGQNPFNPVIDTVAFHADDVSFMIRARDMGYRFFVHPDVHVPHLKLNPIGPG